jgi:hypothetical protein
MGIVLTLVSYLLEPVSSMLYKRKTYNTYANLEWSTNSMLQLQRLAYEGLGVGFWSNCVDTVPTTKGGELLGVLNISDPDHPTIHPVTSMDETSDDSQRQSDIEDGVSNEYDVPNTEGELEICSASMRSARPSGDSIATTTEENERNSQEAVE